MGKILKLIFFVSTCLLIFSFFLFSPNYVSPLLAGPCDGCDCPGAPWTCAKYEGGSDCWTYPASEYCYCMGEFGTAVCGKCICGGEDGWSCFLPGTKVFTPEGEKDIEKIKSGDRVTSYDPETQELTQDTVLESYFVTRDHYYVVRTESGKEVRTTDEHPFYTGSELQPAKSLKDKLINFYSMVIIYFNEGLETVKKFF